MEQPPAARHYQGEEGCRYHQQKRGIPEKTVPWVARLRAEKLSPHIRPEDVVFEYGVGAGWNLAQLNCKRRIGCDVADFLEAGLRSRGIEFVTSSAQIPSASIDVVLCHHALEHVMQPGAVLEELKRVLRPQGKLLLFVPYEKEARYRFFRRDEPNHHLYSWNVQTLGNLVEETGLTVVSAGVGRFGYVRFGAVWSAKLGLGEIGFRIIRRLVHVIAPASEVRIIAQKRVS